jgi:excisionase family DNA binding protein
MALPKQSDSPTRPLALGTEVLTTAQAAKDCNVSVRTLYRAIKSGQLKAYRLNKDFRLKRADLQAWFESLAVTEQDRQEMRA